MIWLVIHFVKTRTHTYSSNLIVGSKVTIYDLNNNLKHLGIFMELMEDGTDSLSSEVRND